MGHRHALLCGPAVFQLRYATREEETSFKQEIGAWSNSAWSEEEEAVSAVVRNEEKAAQRRAIEPKCRPRYFPSHTTK